MTKKKNTGRKPKNYKVEGEEIGIVISLQETYGLIRYRTYPEKRVVFLKKDLISKSIKVNTSVKFTLVVNLKGKHKGKLKAIKVAEYTKPKAEHVKSPTSVEFKVKEKEYVQYQSPSAITTHQAVSLQPTGKNEYIYIGQVVKLDSINQTGEIHCKALKLNTQLPENEAKLFNLKLNDFVVFKPGIHNKDKSHFTLKTIYNKLDKEKDLNFLLKRYSKSPQEEINRQIQSLITQKPIEDICSQVSASRLFQFEFSHFKEVNTDEDYQNLVNIISRYKKVNWSPSLSTLSEKCNRECLIKLFENDVINSYSFDSIKSYFHIAEHSSKIRIINRLKLKERYTVLLEHIDILRQANKLSTVNQELKTLLTIINRNKQTRDSKLFKMIRAELHQNLSIEDLMKLLQSNYIDTIDEKTIINYLEQGGSEFLDKLEKDNNKEELKRYSSLVKVYNKLKNKIKPEKRSAQKTVTKETPTSDLSPAIEEPLSLDKAIDNIKESPFDQLGKLNIYEKIKYLIQHRDDNAVNLNNVIKSITDKALVDYIHSNPWNNDITPIVSEDQKDSHSSFIHDIEKFNETFNQRISVESLGVAIFKSIGPYTVHHIRLWLQGYVDNSFFDYIGFNASFNKLNHDEKREFVKKSNELTRRQSRQKQRRNVKPCTTFEPQSDGSILYYARLENIYFSTQQFQLYVSENRYTETEYHKNAGFYLNGIANNKELNEIEIKITVKENKIEKVENLNEIISKVHPTYKIEDKVEREDTEKEVNTDKTPIYYPVDWGLATNLKNYFYSKQDKNFEIKFIEDSGIDSYFYASNGEKSALFTFKTANNDYAIVWNNVDLSESQSIYVFKAEYKDVNAQLDKLIWNIGFYRQFRQILRRNSEVDYLHQAFKDNVGYINYISKGRGNKNAFDGIID